MRLLGLKQLVAVYSASLAGRLISLRHGE